MRAPGGRSVARDVDGREGFTLHEATDEELVSIETTRSREKTTRQLSIWRRTRLTARLCERARLDNQYYEAVQLTTRQGCKH
jgi:hypothetical protein